MTAIRLFPPVRFFRIRRRTCGSVQMMKASLKFLQIKKQKYSRRKTDCLTIQSVHLQKTETATSGSVRQPVLYSFHLTDLFTLRRDLMHTVTSRRLSCRCTATQQEEYGLSHQKRTASIIMSEIHSSVMKRSTDSAIIFTLPWGRALRERSGSDLASRAL